MQDQCTCVHWLLVSRFTVSVQSGCVSSALIVPYFTTVISCTINNIVTVSLSMNSQTIALLKTSYIRKLTINDSIYIPI